jgi:hypothetical protein
MSKNNYPVSVVIPTREIDDSYINHVSKMFSHPKTQIIVYENNGDKSLPQIYNEGLSESIHDIVVFMHDDLIIETTNVTKKLTRLFDNNPDYGIIGVAGTNKLLSGCWWQERSSIQGQVKHQHEGRTWRSDYSGKFGENLKQVVIVDGLFFAVHKQRIKHKFDEEFPGFHFYDLPICVANHADGIKVGVTTKIQLIHKSLGPTSPKWEKNKYFFEAKYGHLLPIILE